ncbi:HlyD family efflux transporter periplasmic adaptor subunit [Altererythrobacter sp. ZODW24]|uniref:HlyD family efflux transporter periplasmic adaptor subunit n=1 Tax=Altererythrobacter sp. ZODW24 TaxID=2185142 RepID=UPI000DF81569|nr:HlyD family efflux transporter periplasmic adaptor subunit [Altererythrobacter sp. ZODW24]
MGDAPESTGPNSGGAGKRVLRLIVLLAIIAAAVWFGGKALGLWGVEVPSEPVIYGNVEIREAELGFRIPGRIERVLVDEGDLIQPGQLLAELDTQPMRDSIAGADALVAQADAEISRDRAGSRPQEVRSAEAAVASAQTALNEAQRQFDRRASLLDRGFISRADYETAQATRDAARARLQDARATLSLSREGTRTEDRQASLARREAAVAERRSMQTNLSDAELRAPEAGQVLTRAREAGSIINPGDTVLTIALTQPVRVRAYIAETQLPSIKPGMKASISVDGSDVILPATVGFISPSAEFTPRTVQTEELRADLVYRVRLTVEDPKGTLRQGQPVTVRLNSSKSAE